MNEQTFVVEYDSNNSGGSWWLKDEDWAALEKAGWYVQWLGLSFCHARYPGIGGAKPAPETCPDSQSCHGHRGANSYEEAIAAGRDARWLGALAREATFEVTAYSAALAESNAQQLWSEDIGFRYSGDEEGCNCCGRPHYFSASAKELR